MDIGMVGLGRMGGRMARRLLRGGHRVVGFDPDARAVEDLAADGGAGAASLDALVAALAPPRAVWLMVPAGAPTEQAIASLAERLGPGDVVVDGGNSWFKDDVRRAELLRARGVRFLDAGTSGGVAGLERGYCLMVGGDRDAFDRLEPVLRTLAPGSAAAPPTPGRAAGGTAEEGYLYCGPAGAGHFVKMIHNGVEYGLMQAYAEGFDLLRGAAGEGMPEAIRYRIDLAEVAELWRRGSVVTSWLLDLSAAALARDPGLEAFEGAVADSGEGRWTIQAAVEEGVAAPALSAALFARFRSRRAHTFGEKLLSAMRRGFGGHHEAVKGGSR
ncbi:6-phosphogluconate dehydrogenase, decarboxylating [Anaeromyxobacter sp. K]|uniref:phosphogluconate dehydrogenase (NAD(+)-dependent, decarboxylating) n=1 Tax=Anaeromyxobacter sp. (strain K) TaxID=447217 RepID=UPI00015F9EC6|nr:decarboxylating 6-phosphogluconate dehydrogenase [Anaeromyxobacter sp. K]ACG73649.1 6-phosphogluconate dehydrogenase, decarboxylating [Anaeromyxobacter sp. K]